MLRGHLAHLRRHGPAPDPAALLPLDAILLSHAHADHLDPRSLRMLDPGCPVIAPAGCQRLLGRLGVGEPIEVKSGDSVSVGSARVEAVPARHDGRRYPVGRRRAALGYLIDGPPRVYFAGDTDLFPEMAELRGRVDVAAVPVWGWGPRLPTGHLDPQRAAGVIRLIEPDIAIPIHWGTLVALGSQRHLDLGAPAREFADAVARVAPGVDARVLAPGDRLDL
jgi:L-ascorbate metabolism protein UlaG (beta-lactamase superfamily)